MSDLIRHQPRPSEDTDLDSSAPPAPKSQYYRFEDEVLQRGAFSLDYPETRALLLDPGRVEPVCPDEFVGTIDDTTGRRPVPNEGMPEANNPESILGGEFRNSGNAFDLFLETLRQLCRNYNYDLYQLRQDLFRKKFQTGAFDLPPKVAAFRTSANNLSNHLELYDPRLPYNNRKFANLAVEFVKVNGYIASIRAAATERHAENLTMLEAQYSSSSHISVSSMFSSFSSGSSSSSSLR